MELDFTKPGEVRVGMTDYVNKMSNDVSELLRTRNTPESEYLFNTQ